MTTQAPEGFQTVEEAMLGVLAKYKQLFDDGNVDVDGAAEMVQLLHFEVSDVQVRLLIMILDQLMQINAKLSVVEESEG